MRLKARHLTAIGVLALAAGLLGSASATQATPDRTQQAPRTTSPPTIEGTFREGSTVTATNGLWANNPNRFTYRWQRCTGTAGSTCTNIAGATSRTYRLVRADVGRRVRVLVTASNADGSSTANSQPSPVVSPNVAPAVQQAPAITGTPRPGEELTVSQGTWTGAPDRFTFQWQRCDAAGGGCAAIAGATSRTYVVRTADVGNTLRASVTAHNPRGSTTHTTDRTGVVQTAGGGGGDGTGGAGVAISQVSLPNRLVISRVAFSPPLIRSRAVPIVARVLVTDLRGRAVRGAVVFMRGVPSNRVTTEPERFTDATGVATFTFRPLARLPMVRGASLVFFVRARKPGESLLAGVSIRRLVQIRVSPA